MDQDPADPSAGYDALAREFMHRRDRVIGVSTVREWARQLSPGGAVLDLGCGSGVPISEALVNDGFEVYGIDASPAMVAAFQERFPRARVACEPVEESDFFGRRFDGAVAWGLLFLLPPGVQVTLIHRVATALESGGRFLFTSPAQACEWTDVMTSRQSISLGASVYRATLLAAGFTVEGEYDDEGDNHYYDGRRR